MTNSQNNGEEAFVASANPDDYSDTDEAVLNPDQNNSEGEKLSRRKQKAEEARLMREQLEALQKRLDEKERNESVEKSRRETMAKFNMTEADLSIYNEEFNSKLEELKTGGLKEDIAIKFAIESVASRRGGTLPPAGKIKPAKAENYISQQEANKWFSLRTTEAREMQKKIKSGEYTIV